MAKYTFERVDAATRVRREQLQRLAPGWGVIQIDRPQFALFNPDGTLADWPLIESFEEAVSTCREFNADDDEWRNEQRWQARMGGDPSA